jgi:hypothetical protein
MVPCRQTTPVQLVGHSFPSPPVTWVTPIIGPNSITQKFRIVLLKVPDDTVRADIRSQVVKFPRDPFPGPFFDAGQRAEHSHPIPIGAITDGPCKSGLSSQAGSHRLGVRRDDRGAGAELVGGRPSWRRRY